MSDEIKKFIVPKFQPHQLLVDRDGGHFRIEKINPDGSYSVFHPSWGRSDGSWSHYTDWSPEKREPDRFIPVKSFDEPEQAFKEIEANPDAYWDSDTEDDTQTTALATTRKAKRDAGIPDVRTRKKKDYQPSLISNTGIERVNLEENPDIVSAFALHHMAEDTKAILSSAKVGSVYRLPFKDKAAAMYVIRNIQGTFTVLVIKGAVYAERIS